MFLKITLFLLATCSLGKATHHPDNTVDEKSDEKRRQIIREYGCNQKSIHSAMASCCSIEPKCSLETPLYKLEENTQRGLDHKTPMALTLPRERMTKQSPQGGIYKNLQKRLGRPAVIKSNKERPSDQSRLDNIKTVMELLDKTLLAMEILEKSASTEPTLLDMTRYLR
ncbi:MAG: hypothetical protein K2X98_00820 [Alphaproteobacteria bacterium]|nr:hypothetical protein [Alphaproteobacteria bacterium]